MPTNQAARPALPAERSAPRFPLDHDPIRLRRRRMVLGLTQAEVAAAAGVSAGHLSELESGKRNPSPAALLRLAEALECKPSALMSRARAR